MKVYRVKDDHVLGISNTNQANLEMAYVKGYSFVRVSEDCYLLHTNKTRSKLIINLVDLEIV